jgi:hypothetical protein
MAVTMGAERKPNDHLRTFVIEKLPRVGVISLSLCYATSLSPLSSVPVGGVGRIWPVIVS